jgi:hypothetical protein
VTALRGYAVETVYGVVRFEPGPERLVRDTVITFESARAADSYAVAQGWDDYAVCALRFLIDRPPIAAVPGAYLPMSASVTSARGEA